MTPRQRILSVLGGQMPDKIPFTIKRPQPPIGPIERKLRNDGLAVCMDKMVFHTVRPSVEVFKYEYYKNDKLHISETFRTPAGEVSQLWISGSGGYGSDKLIEYMIKKPEDYKVVEFLIRDAVYTAAYGEFKRTEEILGGDGFIFAGWMPPTPMMQMLWQLMGIETFSVDYFEIPDIFFSLYEILLESQRQQYEIIADSPALVAHIEENMTSDMIGLERFEKYVVPCYNQFASILHKKGKFLAAHFDGRMKVLAQALADSDMDIVEAFCPAPDGDMEMAEARCIWKDKIIWINFPSPVHLLCPDEITAHTRKILRDVAPGDKFIFGITEDIPDKVWEISLPIISKILKDEAVLPIS
ncbi:MAG: uroporphyrinogen decarboxylase family protein [Sedimentisphaerales bacterium]